MIETILAYAMLGMGIVSMVFCICWTIHTDRIKRTGLVLVLLLLPVMAYAGMDEADVDRIASAIYRIEGAERAIKPFGILSVPCDGYAECRRVCENTIRNNYKRYLNYGYKTHDTFTEFLASKYAPVSAHPLNANWHKNLVAILEKEE